MMSQNSKSSDLILNVETEGNLVASKKNYWKNKTNSEAAFKTTRVPMRQKKEYRTFQYEMNNTTNCSENLLNSRNKILHTQSQNKPDSSQKDLLKVYCTGVL